MKVCDFKITLFTVFIRGNPVFILQITRPLKYSQYRVMNFKYKVIVQLKGQSKYAIFNLDSR